MRFEIYNGDYVGTAEWSAPGRVALDVADPAQRTWFERYFASEDSFLTGSVGFEEIALERRDSSRAAFTRAAVQLAAYAYRVRDVGSAEPTVETHRVIDLEDQALFEGAREKT
ncbi:MAG: hypothetical protein ABR529_03140 [Actinomycetota bacterium]